jgi:cold shock CspA family protein
VISLILIEAAAPGAAQDQVVRVQGRVQWIAGEKMMLIPDNGALPIEIDIKQVPQDDYRTLKEGDPVVVSGGVSRDGRKLIATSVQPAGG